MAGLENLERWTHPISGQEYWVERVGGQRMVRARVKSGNPHEDCKEDEERSQAVAFLRWLGWPEDSKIERPSGSNYEFDCRRSDTNEHMALEIKRIVPEGLMAAAAVEQDDPRFMPEVEFSLSAFIRQPSRLVEKANVQLAGARAARRCVLFVLPYEPLDDDHLNLGAIKALGRLDMGNYQNVDEVWLTAPHLRRFSPLGKVLLH